MPDLSEGASSDANRNNIVDFLDPAMACSTTFLGQVWKKTSRAAGVHVVSCEDTVANGAAGCPAGQASCQGKLNRFHGNTSDVYTIQCPANCASDPTPVYPVLRRCPHFGLSHRISRRKLVHIHKLECGPRRGLCLSVIDRRPSISLRMSESICLE